MNDNGTVQGWVPQTDGRGTMDIIWTCGITVSVCCWTSVCVNIPAITDTRWDRLRDKINLFCVGLLGPDFIIILAIGQWESARRSVKKFHSAGYPGWSLKHAFFADMGGFVLQTPGWPLFPLDAEQLFYLVTESYVPYPDIGTAVIDDKNKADGLARFLTVCQVLIFTVTCLARAIQHLTITTLELTTLAFVFAMIATSFFWRSKPQDIGHPIILQTDTSIAQILKNAGDAAKEPYKRTPLDFLSREEWFITIFWTYYLELLGKLHMNIFTRRIKVRPVNRIRSDNFPAPSLPMEVLCGVFMVLYSAIFVAGWNFPFPSETEHLLWNISSLITLGYASLAGLFFFWCDNAYFHKWRQEQREIQQYSSPSSLQSNKAGNMVVKAAAKIRNISPDKDIRLQIPIRIMVPCTILSAAYCVARAYILVEDLVGLRSLPSSAFQTVDWSQYIPQL